LFIADRKKLVFVDLTVINIVENFLANLTPDQFDLLQGFAVALKDKARIHATAQQWKIFKTFPDQIKDTLRLYISKSIKKIRIIKKKKKNI